MTDLHAFEKGGENFLFFPRSARLYQLSRQAAGMLAELSPPGISAVPAPRPLLGDAGEPDLGAELRDLMQRELAVSPPAPSSGEEPDGRNGYQSFSLYLAQTCNMSCRYCWNRGGSFGKPARLMSRKNAKLVTKLVISLVEASSAAKIFVNFYGGEPLLNFQALKKITLDLLRQEARLEKRFHFTVDTNGSLLEGETAQFLARHFSQIGVSLDGRQEIHDLQRPGKLGESTWQRIVDNVKSFPDPKLLGLRATLTAFSDSYLETFRQLSAVGVGRIQLEYCHEPGYHQNPSYETLIVPQERQQAELCQFVDDYVETISRYPNTEDIPHISSLMDNIARVRRGDRYTKPCGAGMNTLAIDCRGEVFPCIAFVDRADFAMGRAGTAGRLSLHQSLAGFEVDGQSPCDACWLRYDCAGGCYATHYNMTGHARQPHPEYCQNKKAKAEIHFYALSQMQKKCPWHLEGAS